MLNRAVAPYFCRGFGSPLVLWFSKYALWLAAQTPGNLLARQVLGSHPGPMGSEACREERQEESIHQAFQVILRWVIIWDHHPRLTTNIPINSFLRWLISCVLRCFRQHLSLARGLSSYCSSSCFFCLSVGTCSHIDLSWQCCLFRTVIPSAVCWERKRDSGKGESSGDPWSTSSCAKSF